MTCEGSGGIQNSCLLGYDIGSLGDITEYRNQQMTYVEAILNSAVHYNTKFTPAF